MSNTKTKTEIFEELSPKYFYDVSPEAAVKFLNSQGFNITTLEELDDNAIDLLCQNNLELYKFALAGKLHNKPIKKVSPGEEQLPSYYWNNGKASNWSESYYHWYRGISELLNSYSTMKKNSLSIYQHERIVLKFALNGFDEDNYFYYSYSYDMSKRTLTTNICYEALEEVHFGISNDRSYYDKMLRRDRYFKSLKVISIDM